MGGRCGGSYGILTPPKRTTLGTAVPQKPPFAPCPQPHSHSPATLELLHVCSGAPDLLCHAIAAAAGERLLAAGFNFLEKPNVWRWAPCTAHPTAPNYVPTHCAHFAILISRLAQAESSPFFDERRLSTSRWSRSRASAAESGQRKLGARPHSPFRSAPRTSRTRHAP